MAYLVENPADMRTPQVQRLPPFGKEVVPLIHGGNARDRTGLMVQDFVRYVRRTPSRAIPDTQVRRRS